MKRAAKAGIPAVLIVLSVSCGGSAQNFVEMSSGQRFNPQRLTVAAGTTVTFVNESQEPHTVTADGNEIPAETPYFASGGFPSEKQARRNVAEGLVRTGEEFAVRLDEPGTYAFFCIPHESAGMQGTIVVEP